MTDAAHIAAVLTGSKVRALGDNYLVRCPAHDDDMPSLSLRDGDRGLIVHCFAGCSASDVYAAIRRKDHSLLRSELPAPEPAKGSGEYERRQHDKAHWMWRRRRPITGTIAETYLRETRCYTGPLPATIAFLPAWRDRSPAMMAAFAMVDEPEPGVVDVPRDVNSVHLTLLRADGHGKADVKPNKLVIGRPLDRPIVLAPPNDLLGLAITEGIEDALTVYHATGLGAWAAGAAGFMPRLVNAVPNYIEAVTIYAHADKSGEDGARKLAAALHERGIEVAMEGI
jgi:hypothetical protein